MRRLIHAVLLAATLSLLSVASAFAQVHTVTPLSCPIGAGDTVPNNAIAGGQATLGTPAHSTQGGPIVAPIPVGTGGASFGSNVGDAGQHSSHCQ
jgi:hypothetical protein